MDTKVCRMCGKEFPIEYFYKKYADKDDRHLICKYCSQSMGRKYNKRNNDLRRAKNNSPVETGYKICSICKRELPVEMFGISKREKDGRRYECRECRKKQQEIHSDHISEYHKRYYQENKDEIKRKSKIIRENSKDYIREYNKKYVKERKEKDGLYNLKKYIQKKIRTAFYSKKNRNKASELKNITGLNGKDLRIYLLKTFKDRYGYDWEGAERTNIDHIIPLCTAKTKEEVVALNHFSNLQLLKEEDNIAKGKSLYWV